MARIYCFISLLCAVIATPVTAAAPVPPKVGNGEFGSAGLLTRSDLDRVGFDSHSFKDGKLQTDEKPPRYDIAVHMTRFRFAEGEPIPAYFLMRNNTREMLELDASLELFRHPPELWNACSIAVYCRTTGQEVPLIPRCGWRCGGPAMTCVPASGYFCMKGDLGRLPRDQSLPPGEYEVSWRYLDCRSATMKFVVEKSETPKIPAKVAKIAVYPVTAGCVDLPERPGETIALKETHFQHGRTAELATTLAVAPFGTYVPDIREIPSADRLIEAAIEWKRYRSGDRALVTLLARSPHQQVRFREVPHLYLVVETDASTLPEHFTDQGGKDCQASESLVTPLVLELRLPENWKERISLHGPARIAVLLSAEKLEMPSDRMKQKLKDVSSSSSPTWSGVLRTPFKD